MPDVYREKLAELRAAHRRARKIRNRVTAVAITAGGYLLTAWSLMITAGIAHRDWWPLVPVMGFHTAFALIFLPFTLILITTIWTELAKQEARS
jgi:fatty acid desaturase